MSIMDQFASQTRFSSLTDLETALFACTACPLRGASTGRGETLFGGGRPARGE